MTRIHGTGTVYIYIIVYPHEWLDFIWVNLVHKNILLPWIHHGIHGLKMKDFCNVRSQEPQKCAKKISWWPKNQGHWGKNSRHFQWKASLKITIIFLGRGVFFLFLGVGGLQKIEFIEVSGFEEQFNTDSVFLGNFFKVGSWNNMRAKGNMQEKWSKKQRPKQVARDWKVPMDKELDMTYHNMSNCCKRKNT